MKVTIFGFAGTGKSSVAEAIAEKLKWEFMSNGNLFRELAKEREVTLSEFESMAVVDASIDRELDARTKRYGETHDNFIFEARLAWYFIPDSVKIKLTCSDDERLRRISERDGISIEEARRQTVHREMSYVPRFREIYGIEDYSSDKNFDFVLDTTHIGLEAVIEKVYEFIITRPEYV